MLSTVQTHLESKGQGQPPGTEDSVDNDKEQTHWDKLKLLQF